MKIKVQTDKFQTLKILSQTFAGGERHVQITSAPETLKCAKIIANISCSDDLMDLLLVENALRHRFGASLRLDLEIPYLPYSRQDRVCAKGQAFSLEVLAHLVQSMNFRKVITWDCHSNTGLELLDADNVSASKIIEADERLSALLQSESTVLICPDSGAKERCKEIELALGLRQTVQCEKRRDPKSGRITQTEVLADDLSGMVAVITDDICDGGSTFLKIAEQLKAKGAAKVVLYVTHGIFSKGLDVFEGLISEVFTTRSFEHEFKTNPQVNFHYVGGA